MVEQSAGFWFRFVVAALATWRVAFLVAREEGPWRLLARLRGAADRAGIGRGIGCVKCASVWIAAPLAWFVGGGVLQMAVTWLALSGAAALIDEWTRPPFEWRDQPDDGMLRRNPDRTVDRAAPDEG